uniref:RNA-directed RNA polymerase n=1 Tax=Alternaria dianthicola umbra-like virus 1 TaxID=2992034 RepID=A0A9E7V6R9_9TOMB|nr:RNA-dependent RNA polymerase [Alternaria dianthicola umbra-like virus 1]
MYTVCNMSFVEGCWAPSVHTNCNHNETVALLKRSLAPTPTYTDNAPVLKVFGSLRQLAKRWGGSRWSDLETAMSYTGAMRLRYLKAEESLRLDGPITSVDSKLGAFLKAEKFGYGKYGKPRMIFPRSPRYNLKLASFLKPFEHWLWGYLTGRRLWGGNNTRVVAKGLNGGARAQLIGRKFKTFTDCVVFEVDGSAFEAHVDSWQLEAEHGVYMAAHSGAPELARLLARQLVNEGNTPGGLRFSRAGGRASGDFNTGMGNTLIMLAVVVAVLRHLKVPFDVLVDGDNALVFLSQCDSARVCSRFAELALLFSGHEMVLENPVTTMEHIRFGQSAPVEVSSGRWTMVRSWDKVVSHMTSSHAHLQQPAFALPFLRGVAQCELALHQGLPVAQFMARNIIARTEGVKAVGDSFYRDYEVMGVSLGDRHKSRFVEPTMTCRESFARAFGLEPDQQLQLERDLEGLTIDVGPWQPEESPFQTGFFSARPGLVDKFNGV